jgi:hypothetical protein
MIQLRYRFQGAALIGMAVLWGLFKLNFLSAGWNILVGLIITALLFIVTGLVADD